MKEKNTDTLKAAIRNLPEYIPPADIWQKLEHALFNEVDDIQVDGFETNRSTLLQAIDELPQYVAPYELWENINEAMDADEYLSTQVKNLPQYAAPAKVWTNIESALEQEPKSSRAKATRARISFYHYAAAAAFAGVLLGAWWLLGQRSGQAATESVVVSQQQLDTEVIETIKEEDPAFQMVQDLCQERVPVCEKPEFKVLKSELDELTQAKQELRLALGNYGDDPNLSSQLVKIEQERSQLLKQMIQMI